MISKKQLLNGEGKYWQKRHSDELTSIESLAWHAASDLSDFVENTMAPEELPKTLPPTYLLLWGLEAYFAEKEELLSQSHAMVMLAIKRAEYRLTPDGDDT